jgi:hypothetical protein
MLKKESYSKKIKRFIFILRLKPKLSFLKKEFSITNLKPYIQSEWHHGFAFFIGYKNHKKIFLKIINLNVKPIWFLIQSIKPGLKTHINIQINITTNQIIS